jgi:hypothetical protein
MQATRHKHATRDFDIRIRHNRMPKVMSIAQLGRGGLARAIRAAQREPVLISELNHPVAWVISAEALARAASRSGTGDTYQSMLAVLGIELNHDEVTPDRGLPPPNATRPTSSTGETDRENL